MLPVIFVIIALIIEQQIPKPEDSPSLLMSFDRYAKTNVPYTYDQNQTSSIAFIRSYEYALEHSTKAATLIDLTSNATRLCPYENSTDIISYLICIGERSLQELSDQYLIGVDVRVDPSILNIIALFNNQPYHIPPLTLNYLTNALLNQYSPKPTMNRTIQVANHPVRELMSKKIYFVFMPSSLAAALIKRSHIRFSITTIFRFPYGIDYCVWFQFSDGIICCFLNQRKSF